MKKVFNFDTAWSGRLHGENYFLFSLFNAQVLLHSSLHIQKRGNLIKKKKKKWKKRDKEKERGLTDRRNKGQTFRFNWKPKSRAWTLRSTFCPALKPATDNDSVTFEPGQPHTPDCSNDLVRIIGAIIDRSRTIFVRDLFA